MTITIQALYMQLLLAVCVDGNHLRLTEEFKRNLCEVAVGLISILPIQKAGGSIS